VPEVEVVEGDTMQEARQEQLCRQELVEEEEELYMLVEEVEEQLCKLVEVVVVEVCACR
jgi:hypothetical protein